MADSAPDPGDGRAPAAHPGLPRWVMLLGIGAALVSIGLVVAMLLVGGQHGPGVHGG